MSNKILSCLIVCLSLSIFSLCAQPYSQVRIPLGSESLPVFEDAYYGYYMEGFEVDDEERFYFASGNPALITCFEGKKRIYKKDYNFGSGYAIHLRNDTLYNISWEKGNRDSLYLSRLHAKEGTLIDRRNIICAKKFPHYFYYTLSAITVGDYWGESFEQLDYRGNLIGKTTQPFGVNPEVYRSSSSSELVYEGLFQGYYLLFVYDSQLSFVLKNAAYQEIYKQTLPEDSILSNQ